MKVDALIGDHMVVQRDRPLRLAGTAAPGEAVTATIAAAKATTKADAAGRWSMALPALPAGGPYTLKIRGTNTLTFSDVWAGEVWVASGQSNMEFPLQRSKGGADAAALGCSGLRLFTVANPPAAAPVTKVGGEWRLCDAANAAGFSAAAFHFGRELHRALGVAVGIVQASVGGTPAEAWTPREALRAEPTLAPMVEALDRAMNDTALHDELAKKLAAWEAKNFHQDQANRGEKRGWARAGGGRWETMAIPQLWENAGPGRRRRDLVSPRGDRARGVGGRRAGAVAGRDRRLRRHLLERRAHRRHRRGDAAVLVGAAALPGARAAGEGRAQRARGARVRSLRRRRLRGDARADEPAPGGGRGDGGEAPLPLAGTWSYKIERKLKPAVADWNTRPKLLGTDDPSSPTVLWNALVAPLVGLPIAGVIWYQGESNVERAAQYRTLFPLMIRAWRAAWNDPKLPFLFVQLPNFERQGAPSRRSARARWAELREAQALALREPKTAMAVTLDIGDAQRHPPAREAGGRPAARAGGAEAGLRRARSSRPGRRSRPRCVTARRSRSGSRTSPAASPRRTARRPRDS